MEPSKTIRTQFDEVMLCPQLLTMNKCWPTPTNPTESKGGYAGTQLQQAEAPLARVLNPPPHTPE